MVPWSRPSVTVSCSAAKARCQSASRSRTLGLSATKREALVTSTLRIAVVTSSWSRVTFPGGSLTMSREASSPRAWSLDRSVAVRSAARVTARYMAPVSRNRHPSRSASRRATVLLPAPAGPSMVTTRLMGSISNPLGQPLPAGEAGVELMPEHHLGLSEPPAEVDFPPDHHAPKITQTFLALELYTEILELLDVSAQL